MGRLIGRADVVVVILCSNSSIHSTRYSSSIYTSHGPLPGPARENVFLVALSVFALFWFCLLFRFCFSECLSHLLRGGTTSLRIHLASGSGYFFFPSLPSLVFACYSYYFSGYSFCFFFFLFLFFVFFCLSFFLLSFNIYFVPVVSSTMAWHYIVYSLLCITMYLVVPVSWFYDQRAGIPLG